MISRFFLFLYAVSCLLVLYAVSSRTETNARLFSLRPFLHRSEFHASCPCTLAAIIFYAMFVSVAYIRPLNRDKRLSFEFLFGVGRVVFG